MGILPSPSPLFSSPSGPNAVTGNDLEIPEPFSEHGPTQILGDEVGTEGETRRRPSSSCRRHGFRSSDRAHRSRSAPI
ncbi:hypothetical protein ACFX2B_024532 [Malus domestica]